MTRNLRIWSESNWVESHSYRNVEKRCWECFGRSSQSGIGALPVMQLARKADTKAIWICDYEISETVIPVVN